MAARARTRSAENSRCLSLTAVECARLFPFGSDESATNFVYDTYVYVTDPSYLANLEMDTNQVWDSNNDVLIYGTQCASNGYWEYTTNDSGAHWNVSTVTCKGGPPKWQSDYWHHVQIKVHRDGSGNAYYDSVTLDGVTSQLNDSGFSFIRARLEAERRPGAEFPDGWQRFERLGHCLRGWID